jgi:hypothetical protein
MVSIKLKPNQRVAKDFVVDFHCFVFDTCVSRYLQVVENFAVTLGCNFEKAPFLLVIEKIYEIGLLQCEVGSQ